MFNFKISKEKAGSDENVIYPVKNSKRGEGKKPPQIKKKKNHTQNKILEINSNKKIRKKIVYVQEGNLNVNEVIFLVKRQNMYPAMAPWYLSKHCCNDTLTRLCLAQNFTVSF